MIHAYSESYLYDAKQNLAECFDYDMRVKTGMISKEEWLKDILSVYPNQKGRPSKDISLKKMKLKTKLMKQLVK